MKLIVFVVLSGLALRPLPSCAQSLKNRSTVGEEYAKEQVHLAMQGEKHAKLPSGKPLLVTKNIAIAVAEPMLFNLYGKDNIVMQRPYEIYLIDGFWFITGTLPKDSKGGTFEIIMEASTSQVIDISHGK